MNGSGRQSDAAYAFGDSDLAAARLGMLARVFAETTGPFVDTFGGEIDKPALVIDLGCGPGCTTSLLAGLLDAGEVVGLDSSERFVELANRTAIEGVSFRVHDVTQVPFPAGPANVMYCRFLLTHLADPAGALAAWATQLVPGGRLLVEETDAIDTDVPAFAEYMDIVARMLAVDGRELYIGPTLDAADDPPGLVRRVSQVANLRAENRSAAGMFAMNIRSWRQREFIRDHYAPEAIDALEAQLRELTQAPPEDVGIEWTIRQMGYVKCTD